MTCSYHSFACSPAGKYWSPGHPPPTSPGRLLKILFEYSINVQIWRPGDVLKWCPGDILIWRSRNVPGRLIRDVARMFSRLPLEDLQNTSWQRCGVISSKSQIFYLLFFQNLFDWTNLSKSNSTLKVYWEPSRNSKMDHFLQI